mmetsp:Transcript_11637/g.17660  ORF Transcript_11637/g.17660 Transcript_11637/m.17660 type:complete len:88 (+) Transcript_11637:2436-2699(+)
MHYFIKRRLPFTDILLKLKLVQPHLKITSITLFDYLMFHSDSDLKTLLIISCSHFMAVPFFSKSAWTNEEIIYAEHFYVFERSESLL